MQKSSPESDQQYLWYELCDHVHNNFEIVNGKSEMPTAKKTTLKKSRLHKFQSLWFTGVTS